MRRPQAGLAAQSGASSRSSATTDQSSTGSVIAFVDAPSSVAVSAAALAFLSQLDGGAGQGSEGANVGGPAPGRSRSASDSASSSDPSSTGAVFATPEPDFQDLLSSLQPIPSASSPAAAASAPPSSQTRSADGANTATAPFEPDNASSALRQALEAYAANSSLTGISAGAAAG